MVELFFTISRLGFASVFRVLIYRFLIKFRLHSVTRIKPDPIKKHALSNSQLVRLKKYDFKHFWFFNKPVLELPSWRNSKNIDSFFLINWFNGFEHSIKKYWYEIKDFDAKAGDIKGVWELSRWSWAVKIASDCSISRNEKFRLINDLFLLWRIQNPFLRGPNWKCGQEVSLRLINYLVSLRILNLSPGDLDKEQKNFVEQHLVRISPTLDYAKGQKNNHWISEATGLIIGGIWLGGKRGELFYKTGCKELIEAISSLFGEDGSFAQSSFNYLRHSLSLISIAKLEVLISKNKNIFSSSKLDSAFNLFCQFSHYDGKVSHNWGANDGSNPLSIVDRDFLDSSSHLGFFNFAIYQKKYVGDNNVVNALCSAYLPKLPVLKNSDNYILSTIENRELGFTEFKDGGLAFFRTKNYQVLIRLPKFNFKPSQDDVGHFDLIYKGKNCIMDAGTFSYFTDKSTFEYFQGVHSHNTVYRKSAPYSMKKLSKFIFSNWTSGSWIIESKNSIKINFSNQFSDVFQRKFTFNEKSIEIADIVLKSAKNNDYVTALNAQSNRLIHKSNALDLFGDKDLDSWRIEGFNEYSCDNARVSSCYGSYESINRISFPIKNNENRYVIRFK